MRKIAAHYVYWKKLLPLHYVELDKHNLLIGVFPLTEEIAGTEFWDGFIYPALVDCSSKIKSFPELEASGITDTVQIGNKVVINRLSL